MLLAKNVKKGVNLTPFFTTSETDHSEYLCTPSGKVKCKNALYSVSLFSGTEFFMPVQSSWQPGVAKYP